MAKKERVTLFWMDFIRNRIKAYPYKSAADRRLISDFLSPILDMGVGAERNCNFNLRKAKAKVKAQVKEENMEFEELARSWKTALKERGKVFICPRCNEPVLKLYGGICHWCRKARLVR